MKSSHKEKIVINKKYSNIKEYLKNLPKTFSSKGDIIYQGRNTIKTFDIDGIKLNVKSFKKPHFINQFVYATFRQSKARRSYEYAKKLIDLGINTPSPVAYMEYSKFLSFRHSLYVCEHIEVDGEMRILQTGTLEQHKELIKQFAHFTAKLHNSKVLHLDYSSGNILYKKNDDGKYSFYLVDLNRMKFDENIDIKTAAHNFRRLWGSNEMFAYFAKEYALARGFNIDKCLALIFHYRIKFWKKFNKSYPDVKPYVGAQKTRIGYDAKRAMQNFTGLGNYSRFIIKNMAKMYPNDSYFLYSPRSASVKVREELNGLNNITHIIKQGLKPFWRTKGIVKDINKQQLEIYHGLSNELPVGIKSTTAKSIVTIHDLIFRIHPELYQLVDRVIYDAKARYACNNADRIVAVSECTKRDITKIYGIDPLKIDVVYQGCFPIFAKEVDSDTKTEVKNIYNLPDNFILSVGSIEERKNILLIVKALKLVPNIHFVAIGKRRDYADVVEAYVEEHGLADRVHLFSGIPIEHLPAIYQQSKMFIYPSIYEGFGIPLLEAQNSKIPVISATGSCLEEAGGPHSIYVDPYDEIELAKQIERVLKDEELREYMIAEGVEYVKRFSEENCINNLRKIYNKVLS